MSGDILLITVETLAGGGLTKTQGGAEKMGAPNSRTIYDLAASGRDDISIFDYLQEKYRIGNFDFQTPENLPDSRLLEALHAYAADYIAKSGKLAAFGSMDESALLALGILVEEYIDTIIGKEGHLSYAKKKGPDE